MDTISALIQEAKPLYMKRKKRRALIKKASVSFVACLIIGVAFFQSAVPANDINLDTLYADLYDTETFENAFALNSVSESTNWVDTYNIAMLF